MTNYPVLKLNYSFSLDDPYVGVAKHVKTHLARHADNFENYPHDTRHAVATL